jgi:hypothetical protein
MSDTRKTWSVIEVGPGLQLSNNPRHAFEVMKVSDHEEAVDAVVEKAASAIKEWRERCDSLAIEAEDLRSASANLRDTIEHLVSGVS